VRSGDEDMFRSIGSVPMAYMGGRRRSTKNNSSASRLVPNNRTRRP
jgi:hypothetical protein